MRTLAAAVSADLLLLRLSLAASFRVSKLSFKLTGRYVSEGSEALEEAL
jgi:hypothetical protein